MSFVLGCSPAAAQPAPRNPYSPPGDREEQPWDEQKPVLPAFPKDENLVRIQIDGGVSFDFFVDLESVSVGSDGVVRYTLVARSGSGGANVAYEGIRCAGRERKLYALGRADRTWSVARNPQWVPISQMPVNLAQAVLYDAYFCPVRIMVRNADEARKVLKRGGDPRAGGSSDMWNEPR